jgi:hypothetical protein
VSDKANLNVDGRELTVYYNQDCGGTLKRCSQCKRRFTFPYAVSVIEIVDECGKKISARSNLGKKTTGIIKKYALDGITLCSLCDDFTPNRDEKVAKKYGVE